MLRENLPDENILSAAGNFSEKNRQEVFKLIACRQVKEGNYDQAKSFIEEKFGNKGYAKYVLNRAFYSNALEHFLIENYENASTMASKIPDAVIKAEAQTFLIERFYNKNKEQNKAEASIQLSEALKQFDAGSEPKDKVLGLGKILRVNSAINPEQAFPLFEFLILETNKSDSFDSFFDNLEITSIGGIYFKSAIKFDYEDTVKRLTRSDSERTLTIINRLKNPVLRLTLKIGILKTKSSGFYYTSILNFCRPDNSRISLNVLG